MSQSLTLYDLSAELVALMDAWDDPETTEEQREQLRGQLQAYAEAHVRKVDNVRAYLRYCAMMAKQAEAECERMDDLYHAWQARADRLKEVCKQVMQTFQAKRFDGNTGSLLLKGNGGKQRVEITNPELIPDQYCVVETVLPALLWERVLALIYVAATDELLRDVRALTLKRLPRLSQIEAALQKPCDECNGYGVYGGEPGNPPQCAACGGSGKQGVPGARLLSRGEHIEVK